MVQSTHIMPNLQRRTPASQRAASPYEPICSVFRRYLHDQKLKFTPERAMMLDAVLRKDKLFEPEEILNALKGLGHRVSRATVYRTLNHLQDAGIVKQVFFDNRQSYYEVIVGRETHDHLICVSTGRVIEFASDRLRALRDEICREHGFDPLSHQFHIYGLSPQAKQQAAADDATEPTRSPAGAMPLAPLDAPPLSPTPLAPAPLAPVPRGRLRNARLA